MIVKQHAKREKTHSVWLHAMENYKKVESIIMQNVHETMIKKWTDKKKTNLFCEFCKSV